MIFKTSTILALLSLSQSVVANHHEKSNPRKGQTDAFTNLKKGYDHKAYDDVMTYYEEEMMDDMEEDLYKERLTNYDYIEDELTENGKEEQKGPSKIEHHLGYGKEKSAVLKAKNHQPIQEEGLYELSQDHTPINSSFEKSMMTRASTRANYGYRADVSVYGFIYNRIDVDFEKNGKPVATFSAGIWGAGGGGASGGGHCEMVKDIEAYARSEKSAAISVLGGAVGAGYASLFFYHNDDYVGTCFIYFDGGLLHSGTSGNGQFLPTSFTGVPENGNKPSIVTETGCTCKDVWYSAETGNRYEGCTKEGEDYEWCVTTGPCDGGFDWDWCKDKKTTEAGCTCRRQFQYNAATDSFGSGTWYTDTCIRHNEDWPYCQTEGSCDGYDWDWCA